MKLFRLLIFITATILMAGGYLASQFAYAKMIDTQNPSPVVTYAESVDVPIVSVIALIVIVGCVILTVIQEPKEDDSV